MIISHYTRVADNTKPAKVLVLEVTPFSTLRIQIKNKHH